MVALALSLWLNYVAEGPKVRTLWIRVLDARSESVSGAKVSVTVHDAAPGKQLLEGVTNVAGATDFEIPVRLRFSVTATCEGCIPETLGPVDGLFLEEFSLTFYLQQQPPSWKEMLTIVE